MADDKTIIADAGSSIFQSKPDKKSHACLVQYSGTNIGRRYVIDQIDMVIGRSPECSITVNEQSVSRKHASCTTVDGEVSIHDLGSSDGTFVDDNKIDTKTLLDGDILRLGTVLFKYFAQGNV